MMRRKFTAREKVLLLVLAVLLVICGYYLLVAQPVSETVGAAELRQADAEGELVVEEARAQQLRQMQQELDGLDQETHVSEIAAYDNTQNVVRLLNDALSVSDSYNLVFSPVTFEGHIASRTIDMTFTCGSYATARGIAETLYNAPYRCTITALSLLAGEGGADIAAGPVSAKLTVTFFEYAEEPPAVPEAAS